MNPKIHTRTLFRGLRLSLTLVLVAGLVWVVYIPVNAVNLASGKLASTVSDPTAQVHTRYIEDMGESLDITMVDTGITHPISYIVPIADTFLKVMKPAANADLSVDKVASSDQVMVSNSLTYTITVANEGPHEDTNVRLIDMLPPEVDLVSASPECSGIGPVICQLDALDKDATWVVTMTIIPMAAGTIDNKVEVSGDAYDHNLSNNTDTESTKVIEPPTIQFSSLTYNVDETVGPALITVTLSPSSSLTATVDYFTSDGTASVGLDYQASIGTLTFAPGVTSRTFNVSIIDDTLFEENETLMLTLANPTNSTLGTHKTAMLTIVDDETTPTVQFSHATYSVLENTGSALITVTLSSASGLTVTVNYSTSDGTALAGSDYQAVSGKLAFSPNVTSRTLTVPISDDTTFEGDETFTLDLTNPVSATLGARKTATLTIVNNDMMPTVQFNQAVYSAAENAGLATITVTLNSISGLTATVNYSTSNGTALAGFDYQAITDKLTFSPGMPDQTFNVLIIDDAKFEGNETLTLTLANPVSTTLGTCKTAMLTIVDNDPLTTTIYLPLVMKNFNSCTLTARSETEPNDSYTYANGPLCSGINYTGYHNGLNKDKDYFKIYQSVAGKIIVDLTGITNDNPGQDVQLHLFHQKATEDDDRVGYDSVAPYQIVCPSAQQPKCTGAVGWYYILVHTPANYGTNPYTLTATFP